MSDNIKHENNRLKLRHRQTCETFENQLKQGSLYLSYILRIFFLLSYIRYLGIYYFLEEDFFLETLGLFFAGFCYLGLI